MEKVRDLLKREQFVEKSVSAIQLNTYIALWDKVSFLSKEERSQAGKMFVPVRSSDFLTQQMYLAAGLLEVGVEKGDFIGVFSENSLRYAVEIYAILAIGAVFVPVYPSMTEEQVHMLLQFSETQYMFVGGLAQFQKSFPILNRIKSPLRRLFVNYQSDLKHNNILNYEELIELGKKSGRLREVVDRVKEINEGDTAVLIFTPGTTGVPKGVLLSHGNIIAQKPVSKYFHLSSKDLRLSHLPYSHAFGLSADLFGSALVGTVVAISNTFDTEEIIRDIAEIQPTIMCSVPRLYEKLYIHILFEISRSSKIKKNLYTLALNVGRERYLRSSSGRHVSPVMRFVSLMLAFVYKKIRKSINMKNMRLLFSGGGPLPIEVAYFFGSIGLPILEGYGLTETAPIINVNRVDKNKPGTVGPPVDTVEEKISDEGEILIKGPMVFIGYYKNQQIHEEEDVFTPDGFFKTGDIGRFDEDGCLIITGRLKDLIITSSGKNIAPLPIEKKFESDQFIETFCVVGDGRKYLSALVVPDFQVLKEYARLHNIKYSDERDLVKNPEINRFYRERIDRISNILAPYEQIKKFTLLPDSFSVENGELSTTFKFKRHYIQAKYRNVIDCMYPESNIIS